MGRRLLTGQRLEAGQRAKAQLQRELKTRVWLSIKTLKALLLPRLLKKMI